MESCHISVLWIYDYVMSNIYIYILINLTWFGKYIQTIIKSFKTLFSLKKFLKSENKKDHVKYSLPRR